MTCLKTYKMALVIDDSMSSWNSQDNNKSYSLNVKKIYRMQKEWLYVRVVGHSEFVSVVVYS